MRSPGDIVAALYERHDTKDCPLKNPADPAKLLMFFDHALADLILKDQKESNGEVGKLEMDPLYAAQDFDIKHFAVLPPKTKGLHSEVTVKFTNMGASHEIMFDLIPTKKGWRITDIKYDDGRRLKEILK